MGAHAATTTATCLNCAAALAGEYCSSCGQRNVPPTPHLHELLHDALEEFLHFDGKIVQTLRTLLTRPGQLTVDLVAGRRVRYIAPLRLYLTASVLFFVVVAMLPRSNLVTTSSSTTRPKAGGFTFETNVSDRRQLTDEEKRQLLEASDKKAPPLLRPLVHRLIEDPGGLQRDVLAAWPKALFVLLPLFAVIVSLFYHRRHFVEHMYFALHLHAFAFLAMTISSLVSFTHVQWLGFVVGVAVLVWIPTYAHLAFRRVYRSSHVVTVLKETGVGLLYGVALVPAIFVAALWAASHPH